MAVRSARQPLAKLAHDAVEPSAAPAASATEVRPEYMTPYLGQEKCAGRSTAVVFAKIRTTARPRLFQNVCPRPRARFDRPACWERWRASPVRARGLVPRSSLGLLEKDEARLWGGGTVRLRPPFRRATPLSTEMATVAPRRRWWRRPWAWPLATRYDALRTRRRLVERSRAAGRPCADIGPEAVVRRPGQGDSAAYCQCRTTASGGRAKRRGRRQRAGRVD